MDFEEIYTNHERKTQLDRMNNLEEIKQILSDPLLEFNYKKNVSD